MVWVYEDMEVWYGVLQSDSIPPGSGDVRCADSANEPVARETYPNKCTSKYK